MLWKRFFFRAGASVWIAGGVGHFILIDALTLHGRTRSSEFVPHPDILATMEKTTLTFGLLGSTTAFLATAGFSLWVALSLVFLGFAYLLLSQKDVVTLRSFTGLGVVISATFATVAVVCFIFPAAIGAVITTALCVASWIKNER